MRRKEYGKKFEMAEDCNGTILYEDIGFQEDFMNVGVYNEKESPNRSWGFSIRYNNTDHFEFVCDTCGNTVYIIEIWIDDDTTMHFELYCGVCHKRGS